MTGEAPPPGTPADDRPWWGPLLGVGSVGLGGLQALTGLLLCGIALTGPPSSRGAFLLLGAPWLLPGLLLGISGVLVTLRSPRGRMLSLVAVAAGALGIGIVAVHRASVPPSVADAGEWALGHPEAPPWAKKMFQEMSRGNGEMQLADLRDPDRRNAQGWIFTGYCCCPVLPWYLTILFACAPPWGKRIARPS